LSLTVTEAEDLGDTAASLVGRVPDSRGVEMDELETRGISRKQFVRVAGVGLGGVTLASVLAACGGDGGGEAADTVAGTTAAETVTAGGQNATGEPYRIVQPLNLTGPLAPDAEDSKNATELAVQEINDAGGIQGRPIEQVVFDADVTTPDGVSAAMNKAIAEEPDAIAIPHVLANAPALEVLATYGCPYLNLSTSIDQVTQVSNDPETYFFAFQVDPTEVPYGTGFVPALAGIQASGAWTPSSNTIFILEGDGVYEQTISKGMQEGAETSGEWEIVGVEPIVKPVNDWGPSLSKIRDANPGVIANINYLPDDTAAFMKQFVADPTNSLVYIQYAPSLPRFSELAGEAGNGVVWSTVSGRLPDEIGNTFLEKYTAAFNTEPGITNAGGVYDSIFILANAWGRVGDSKNFKAVSDYLRTNVYRGVNGGYSFNHEGQHVFAYPSETPDPSLGQATLFAQVQGGKSTIIDPVPYTEGEYQLAAWQS
jgi:branched-chain amino acid transport system substrate-binding protein